MYRTCETGGFENMSAAITSIFARAHASSSSFIVNILLAFVSPASQTHQLVSRYNTLIS